MNSLPHDRAGDIAMRSIVVTGAAGLVGTRVIQRLLTCGYQIHAVVHTSPPMGHPVMQPGVVLHYVDIANPDWSWLSAAQPVALLHCAAMSNVDECERYPDRANAINEHATRVLALACRLYHIHLLLVSTDYVFDGSEEQPGPYSEDDPVCPLNHYGRSKWRGEVAVQEICEGNTPWMICRTSVVYGPTAWTRPDFTHWLLSKVGKGESVKIVDDQINTPTLSDDLARMLSELVQQQATGIYHTAGSTPINRYQFALALVRRFGLKSSLIQPVSSNELQQIAPRPLKAGLRTDKIRQQLGIIPLSLEEGLMGLNMTL